MVSCDMRLTDLGVQNEEMVAEGELRSHSLEASDQVRALQDSVAELRAEVRVNSWFSCAINK